MELIEVAGLSELFHCPGPFTLLAPSNSALSKIDASTLEELLMPENREKLQNLLLYHFLPGFNLYAGFEPGQVDSLLDGMTVEVSTGPVVFNYRSTAEPFDNVASNGNIILVDEVLIPGKWENDFNAIAKLTIPSQSQKYAVFLPQLATIAATYK